MIVQGKNLMIYIQGDGAIGQADELYPIACDKTCTISMGSDFIETTVKDNGYFRTFLPTLVSIQITGDGLIDYSKVMGVQSLQSKILNRQIVVFKFVAYVGQNEQVIYTGQGYFKTVESSGNVEGGATFNYVIVGTGEPDIDNTVPVDGGGGTPVDDMANIYPLYFRTTNDQTSYQNAVLIGAKLILLSIEQVILFKDDGLGPTGETHWTSFDPATGTVKWNFKTFNKSRGFIVYKK